MDPVSEYLMVNNYEKEGRQTLKAQVHLKKPKN